jgi:putative tributyrin esterase
MTKCDVHFLSSQLGMSTAVTVLLPDGYEQLAEDKTPKSREELVRVLYLLHGRTDDHTAWERQTAIERYAEGRRLVVVMPDAGLSYYQDIPNGPAWFSYISGEVPKRIAAIFGIIASRDRTAVAGLSMGGYGAYRVALTHPLRYSAAGSFSGPLDLGRWIDQCTTENRTEQLNLFRHIFGVPLASLPPESDLFSLVRRFGRAERPDTESTDVSEATSGLPRLYQSCGTEDFLHQNNREAKARWECLGVPVTWHESAGGHDWHVWDDEVRRFLDWWLPPQESPSGTAHRASPALEDHPLPSA